MIPQALRFRRFSLRLLTWLLGLLFAALATTYYVVSRANDRNAREHARANLELAARIVTSAVRQRLDFLALSANVMTGDDALRQVLLRGNNATLVTLLQSFTQRVGAPVIAYYDADGEFLANSEPGMDNENSGPFRFLIREAIQKDLAENSGFSYLKNELHVLIVVPAYKPRPNIVGWFGLAFPIDRNFVEKIKTITRVELTYVASEAPALADAATKAAIAREGRLLASTLAPAFAATTRVAAIAMARRADKSDPMEILPLPDDRYVTVYKWQDMLAEAPIAIVLQRPLTPELEAADELKNLLRLVSLVALAAATILALVIARGVSEPVRQLAAHTEKIAAGDYASRLALPRADELGQLADAMNQMSAGLAERDLVRDLLDKNVSPEVAAQLMRDGSALGGEEREVTILFADLRGFTTLSEKLPPPELLALLNRYLDRMSGAIESHGGVIDKFIGDAIMALFGAPVAQGDAADRALAAALAMERALVSLNAELAVEGRPPLAIGVGVNTARVVAGNIGSQRRLNYSVIGDGVNVAARLQSETRKPEHRTNIITSAATLAACRRPLSPVASPLSPVPCPPSPATRPLGPVQVKGRAEPVEIFAVS